jgi:hypothetical protein
VLRNAEREDIFKSLAGLEQKPRTQERIPESTNWPDPLVSAAFHGIAGETVKAIEPHTESDPAALLIQFLVGFGNLIGRGAYTVADGARHGTNLFGAIVGITSKGRKGTALGHVKSVLQGIEEKWANESVQGGLSSGEGLIWAVRDPIEKQEHIREKGRVVEYQTVIEDHGVSDKRLLVVEPELASALRVMGREGSTLSATIRQAWDTGDLRVLTKTTPARATGAHISILGHITRDELLRHLNATEMANGFANRFLWVCASRSKLLPEGGHIHEVDFTGLTNRLRDAVRTASTAGELKRDEKARRVWGDVYAELSDGKLGMFGCVSSRAEAQVLRLSLNYALLDGARAIRVEHLLAALAVWDYCENSAKYIFGDAVGDPVADSILKALRSEPKGLSRTEISSLFGRNQTAKEIDRALALLREHGLARSHIDQEGSGRHAERWLSVFCLTKETNFTKEAQCQ